MGPPTRVQLNPQETRGGDEQHPLRERPRNTIPTRDGARRALWASLHARPALPQVLDVTAVLGIGALVLGGAAVIVAAPLVISLLVTRMWSKTSHEPRRILAALFLAIGVSTIVDLAVGGIGSGLTSFAGFGLAKRIALPLTYAIFGVLLILPVAPESRVAKPVWWRILFAVVALSTLTEILIPRHPIDVINILEGLLLGAGLLLVSAATMRRVTWTQRDMSVFVAGVGGFALVTQIAGVSSTPFDGLQAPAGFALIYWGLRADRGRVPALVAGIVLVSAVVADLVSHPAASIAVITQVCVCALLLVLVMIPRPFRVPVLLLGIGGAVALAIQTGVWRLLLGQGRPEWDVTLLHRAYEANAAFQLIQDPVSLVIGAGAGSTVDLTNSPDAATLRASGRDLTAVNDVHLLTSWILMKFGVVGLIWLTIFLIAVVRSAIEALRTPKRFSFDFVLVLFVVSAVVAALPAATYLFSNPMLAVCIGILVARQAKTNVRKGRSTESAFGGRSHQPFRAVR